MIVEASRLSLSFPNDRILDRKTDQSVKMEVEDACLFQEGINPVTSKIQPLFVLFFDFLIFLHRELVLE